MNHWITRFLVGKVDMSIISTEDSPWCTPWLTGRWKPIIFLSIRRGPPVQVHHWHWCRRYITVLALTESKTAKVVNTRSADSIPPGPRISPFGCRKVWRSIPLRAFASQFIPFQFKMIFMRSEKPIICALHPVSQKFPQRCLWNSSDVRLTISSSASSFHASPLQVIDGVVSLALFPQVVSQAPQHFRSSEKHATCEGCFSRQCICSVISFHPGMSRAVHQQEFSKVAVDHWNIPVWASSHAFSTGGPRLGVWLSPARGLRNSGWFATHLYWRHSSCGHHSHGPNCTYARLNLQPWDGFQRADLLVSKATLFIVQCCFVSRETVRTIRDVDPRTATSIFTQFLSSVSDTVHPSMLFYIHRDRTDC